MGLDRKTITDIIHTDLITIKGGKNNNLLIFCVMAVFFTLMGFIASPLIGVYLPVLCGTIFVPMLFSNELKYHSEKFYCIVPVSRKDLVTARFIYTTALFAILGILSYLLMLLSLKLKIYRITGGEDADLISLLTKNSQGTMTEISYLNLIYFIGFSVGLFINSNQLRIYFKDSSRFNSELALGAKGKTRKKELVAAGIVFAVLALWVMIMEDILPVGTAVLLMTQILSKFAQAADGLLFGAVIISAAVFSTIYKYICTLLEYNEKEL